jgi:ectoine hydroxylase-related dioxygenase (phytanoyl-CoA dioxygenase family)
MNLSESGLLHRIPIVKRVFSELLGPGYRLIGCTAPVLTAGATFDHRVWHRDFRAHEQVLRERYGEFFMATAVLYTQDESFLNGAIQVVPGSHRWPLVESYITEEHRDATEGALSADGPAGSILFFVGSTFHRSGTLAFVRLRPFLR